MAFFDDDLPGGSSYQDVKPLFLDAVSDLAPEQMLMMKNFTLHDAMMAIEVMDPRMDSGVVRAEFYRNQFDPSAPLLPEEVCWIMDRMFAAEMLWHSGGSLSQSVYTCLYVHELSPGRIWHGGKVASALQPNDPHHSLPLVHIVLRAAVYGLLKTCDIAWREFTKGYVLEMEDFNGEKADRYICETIPEVDVIRTLDFAKAWLLSKQAASLTWRAELVARIELRRAILISLSYTLPAESRHFDMTLRQAHSHLRDIRTLNCPPTPSSSSAAYHSFDPSIHRRLLSVMPLKVISLPEQHDAWERYGQLLDGLQEVGAMSVCTSIIEIKELLDLRSYQPPSPNRSGIVRSLSRTALLSSLGSSWSNQLFDAMANVPPPLTIPYLPMSFSRQNPPPQIQTSIDKMVDEYFASFFSNRPRQRRRLCNWMSEWAGLSPQLEAFVALQHGSSVRALRRLLLALSVLRLMGASHIILSGLELDLHQENELHFVYWYGERLHNALYDKLAILNTECEKAPSTVTDYLSSELTWVGLLGKFFKAACTVSISLSRPLREGGAIREEANLRRRFKWAFDPAQQHSNQSQYLNQGDSLAPNLEEWNTVRAEMRKETMETRLPICADMFHKLEEATRVYEGILLLRRGFISTEVQNTETSTSQPSRDTLAALGNVQERSLALRLNIVRQFQEVATANIKSLSRLGTSEMSRGNPDIDANRKAAGKTLLAGEESSAPSSLASVNEIKIRPQRWFPLLSNLP